MTNDTSTMDAFEMRQRVAQLYADQQSPQEREALIARLARLLDVAPTDIRVQAYRDAKILRGDL